jgi:hypothetical protein
MSKGVRREALLAIEKLRPGRTLVCFFNFDRLSQPPIPGLLLQFNADAKEALYRVLKDSLAQREAEDSSGGMKIDLCLYTRGGDTNAVWPIVSLVREFDPDFEVLVPFRCHSSGTLLALGAKRIVLSPLSELSPIDPSTGNRFNPLDPVEPRNRLAIAVEDVNSYRSFVERAIGLAEESSNGGRPEMAPFIDKLVAVVHPLALGNVERANRQIELLGRSLLELHPVEDPERIVRDLTTAMWSHLHMINRHEAKRILGDRVQLADKPLAEALDGLLRAYEDDFQLRKALFLSEHLKDEPMREERFVGGVLESVAQSYLFRTWIVARQQSALPQNIQVQLPVGQPMPLVAGLPREYSVDVQEQGWVRNKEDV